MKMYFQMHEGVGPAEKPTADPPKRSGGGQEEGGDESDPERGGRELPAAEEQEEAALEQREENQGWEEGLKENPGIDAEAGAATCADPEIAVGEGIHDKGSKNFTTVAPLRGKIEDFYGLLTEFELEPFRGWLLFPGEPVFCRSERLRENLEREVRVGMSRFRGYTKSAFAEGLSSPQNRR